MHPDVLYRAVLYSNQAGALCESVSMQLRGETINERGLFVSFSVYALEERNSLMALTSQPRKTIVSKDQTPSPSRGRLVAALLAKHSETRRSESVETLFTYLPSHHPQCSWAFSGTYTPDRLTYTLYTVQTTRRISSMAHFAQTQR